MDRKYRKSDLDVHTFGHGRNKCFVIYTDYTYGDEIGPGPRWHTRVYPDIQGNKTKATNQALRWLNNGDVPEPWVYKNKPRKLMITYNQYKEAPLHFYETDNIGIPIDESDCGGIDETR